MERWDDLLDIDSSNMLSMRKVDNWTALGALTQRIAAKLMTQRQARILKVHGLAADERDKARVQITEEKGRETPVGSNLAARCPAGIKGTAEGNCARPARGDRPRGAASNGEALGGGSAQEIGGSHLDMLPILTITDARDRRLCDAIGARYIALPPAIRANGEHLLVGKSSTVMLYAGASACAFSAPPSATGVAAFGDHISAIVTARSQEQVFRVETAGHIALVENAQAIRDRAVVGDPRQSVRVPYLLAEGKNPVAEGCHAAQPQNAAGVRLRHRMLSQALLGPFNIEGHGIAKAANSPRYGRRSVDLTSIAQRPAQGVRSFDIHVIASSSARNAAAQRALAFCTEPRYLLAAGSGAFASDREHFT